jgi:hypothetical protein
MNIFKSSKYTTVKNLCNVQYKQILFFLPLYLMLNLISLVILANRLNLNNDCHCYQLHYITFILICNKLFFCCKSIYNFCKNHCVINCYEICDNEINNEIQLLKLSNNSIIHLKTISLIYAKKHIFKNISRYNFLFKNFFCDTYACLSFGIISYEIMTTNYSNSNLFEICGIILAIYYLINYLFNVINHFFGDSAKLQKYNLEQIKKLNLKYIIEFAPELTYFFYKNF